MNQPELLSNFDLIEMYKLFNINLNYIGTKRSFQYIKPKSGNYIINLDDDKGSHWTALILTKHNYAVYFDSFGFSMPNYILHFILRFSKTCKIIYSNSQIQNYYSVLCGYFCFYFHFFVTKLHKHNTNYKYILNKFNSIFTKINRKTNDKIIHSIIFNLIKENHIL